MSRRIISLITVLMLLCCIPMAAQAKDVPQLKDGSITFTIQSGTVKIDGGELRLYRVADIVEDDGNYSFALIPALADVKVDVNDTDDPAVASALAEAALKNNLTCLSAEIKSGEARFETVPHGLYVVVQTKAAQGYALMDPFLISMPRFSDGVYENEISVYPKVPIETEPSRSTLPPKPTRPPSDLPQTGQLNWPVPVLVCLGMAMIVLGFGLRGSRKKDSHEG